MEGFCCQAPSEPRLALLRHQGFRSKFDALHYAARRTSSAKLSFAVSLRPGTVGQAERKQRLYTSVDADRPRIRPAITRERFGGAAGNRTRVQSAYFARVYLHSRVAPTGWNIGAPGFQLKNRLSALTPHPLLSPPVHGGRKGGDRRSRSASRHRHFAERHGAFVSRSGPARLARIAFSHLARS